MSPDNAPADAPEPLSSAQIATLDASAEDLIRAALIQGMAGLLSPGLALTSRAIKEARAKGLTVRVTIAFAPDGRIMIEDPLVVRAERLPRVEA